jgi:hypothetical protein
VGTVARQSTRENLTVGSGNQKKHNSFPLKLSFHPLQSGGLSPAQTKPKAWIFTFLCDFAQAVSLAVIQSETGRSVHQVGGH